MKKTILLTALAAILSMPAIPLAVAAEKTTAPASGSEFRLPAFETIRLPNGLTLMLMERHNAPLIAVTAVINAGAIHDAKQGGLASLTNQALRLGSKQFAKAKLEQAFDFRGALLGVQANSEHSALMADLAAADAPVLLPMLADMLQQPAFDPAEFEKLRTRKAADLKRAKESPNEVSDLYFQSMLFGAKPYGNPMVGSEKSLAAISAEDVRRFHQQYYRPDNAAIVVVGDFKLATMREQLTQLFGGWKAPATPLAAAPATLGEVDMSGPRVWLVNKDDAHETTFQFGGKGIARNDPDYVQLKVINTVLGGRFTSWLNDELRVNSGLSYGASSEFSTLSKTGMFSVSSFTATEKTREALDLAMRTYQRLWDKGMDAATLASARAYVKGQFPPRLETNQQISLLLADMFSAKVGREQIDRFSRDIDSVTPQRARELIQRHFPRENLQMLLIGKAEAIRGIAAKYGKVREIAITADGFGAAE